MLAFVCDAVWWQDRAEEVEEVTRRIKVMPVYTAQELMDILDAVSQLLITGVRPACPGPTPGSGRVAGSRSLAVS
jgi:hypothetical protein